jgi:hypothetical protein
MKTTKTYLAFILICIALITGIRAASAVDNPGQGRSLSVRFPAFSLNPGEKIAGFKVKSSHGQIVYSCLPGRWRCEKQEKTLHCFCLHQTHAIALTGLLPELFIRNIPDRVSQLSLEVSLEYLDDNGKEYSKEFREGDLIIK